MGQSSFFADLTAVTLGVMTSLLIRQLGKFIQPRSPKKQCIVTTIANTPAPSSAPDLDDLWNNVLLFPSSRDPECSTSPINQLIFYLNQAQESIKICVMTVAFNPIYEVLLSKHQKGVEMLVFTSYHTATGKGKTLKKAVQWLLFTSLTHPGSALSTTHDGFVYGIPVRSRPKGAYSTEMHNKYAIIDERAVLTGSMNWNPQSIYTQRENILITNHSVIVLKYLTHFDRTWDKPWDENADNLT